MLCYVFSDCYASDAKDGVGSNSKCTGTKEELDCIPVCKNEDFVIDTDDSFHVRCNHGIWDQEKKEVPSCTSKKIFYHFIYEEFVYLTGICTHFKMVQWLVE